MFISVWSEQQKHNLRKMMHGQGYVIDIPCHHTFEITLIITASIAPDKSLRACTIRTTAGHIKGHVGCTGCE